MSRSGREAIGVVAPVERSSPRSLAQRRSRKTRGFDLIAPIQKLAGFVLLGSQTLLASGCAWWEFLEFEGYVVNAHGLGDTGVPERFRYLNFEFPYTPKVETIAEGRKTTILAMWEPPRGAPGLCVVLALNHERRVRTKGIVRFRTTDLSLYAVLVRQNSAVWPIEYNFLDEIPNGHELLRHVAAGRLKGPNLFELEGRVDIDFRRGEIQGMNLCLRTVRAMAVDEGFRDRYRQDWFGGALGNQDGVSAQCVISGEVTRVRLYDGF